MFKALLLIFEPAATWDRITAARRGLAYIIFAVLLPLLVIPSAIEGYGLVRFGEWQAGLEIKKIFSVREAVMFEIAQTLVLLCVVLIGGKTIKSLGDTFHGRHTYTQALTAVVYGLSPFFLLRVMDCFAISPWIAWTIGILLSMSIMYHGVPRVMEPDPSHAFGLYLTSWLLLALMTGLFRFVTAAYLQGRLPALQRLLA